MPIIPRLDRVMADRKMSVNELSQRIDISPVNISRMRRGHIKAVRFSTMERICEVLQCQPGDLFEYVSPEPGTDEAVELDAIINRPIEEPARKPIGAGPYRLAKWDAGSMLTLTASDTYFEGRPNLDEVVYRIIPDPSTMFLELKAGKLDMMSLSPQQYLRQTQGPQWERDWRKYRYLSFSYTFLGFNLEHPFFKDVRVRRAISMASDRQSLIDGVLLGQGVAYNDKLTPVRQDVDEARRLLDEAGWKKNKDGLLERDGKPFLFTILVNQGNDSRIKAAIIIQSQLKALGITVHIRTVEWAAFIKEFVNKGHFDAIILAWTITLDPDIYDVWHSSRAKPGGLNFTGYRNAEVDELLVEARSMTDQDRRKELYDRVQEILDAEQPYCFLYVPYALPIVQARFQGIKPALNGIMYNFDRWWVPKDLQRYHVRP